MRMRATAILGGLLLALASSAAFAGPDDYIGDTAIYTGESSNQRPNVLFLIDNSGDMMQSGGTEPYDPSVTYPGTYTKNAVYKKLNQSNWQLYVDANTDGSLKVTCSGVVDDLTAYGFSNRNLAKNTGACGGKNDTGDFYLGNLLNKITATQTVPATWAPGTAYTVGTVVKPTDTNNLMTYRCITEGTSGTTEPVWPTTAGQTVTDGTLVWEVSSDLLTVVKAVLTQVSGPLREKVKMGLMTFGSNNHGGYLRAPVKRLGEQDSDSSGTLVGPTNYNDFLNAINDIPIVSSNTLQPVNESLWDARLYFAGQDDSNEKFSTDYSSAPSPLENWCDKNFVIVLTTGSSTPSSQAETTIRDVDGDAATGGGTGAVDDAAKLLYENDFLPDAGVDALTQGDQRIQTSVIQLMTSYVAQLEEATDSTHGRGSYYQVNNTSEIEEALLEIMENIVREADTSFVAPVVPASTTNRTISSNRIYLGLFQPQVQKPWLGNLKKYGVNSANQLVDKNGEVATLEDGTFISGTVSYWGTDSSNKIVKFNGTLDPALGEGDGGQVSAGGVGGTLVARIQAGTARNLYTNVGSNPDLTDSGNAFSKTNSYLDTYFTATAERDKLVDYFQGVDVQDDDEDGFITDTRPWIMGDILHSKPVIFNYTQYDQTKENTCFENDSGANSTMIFVGANDGMLHAFRDCDGREEWAFIPDNVLPSLPELFQVSHNYFVDSSPVLYVHDYDGDGQVDTAVDKVILLIGQRRGGGRDALSASGSRGAYYALDITSYNAPKLLWKIDSSIAGFSELGETWSVPRLAKVKIGTDTKVVAVIGGGYDNNEDLRFGSTQNFPAGTTDTTDTTLSVDNSGPVVSDPTGIQVNPRGRGIFAIEVATLRKDASGNHVADTTNGGTKVWSYTNDDYSFPSDVTVMDTDADGYHDRFYVGDTGGRMWRFNIGDTVTANWTSDIIFDANQESTGNGRKIFYKPSVAIMSGVPILYFGTGDRAHPLNTAVVDRLYAVRDRGQTTSSAIGEANLLDVTLNELQGSSTTETEITTLLTALNSTTNYGWFIKLNENSGEKVLAPATVFNGQVFYSTYAPIIGATDPCSPGNLGISRLYHLNFATGESVYNYDDTNDGTTTNERAIGGEGIVLARDDRVREVGEGIPSGVVTMIDASGKVTMMVSSSNRVNSYGAPDAKLITPVYWMQW